MEAEKNPSKVHILFWSLASVCLLFGTIGIIAIGVLYSQSSRLPYNYGIGIDAGSSRTDFYVYRWPTEKENGTGIAEQIYKCPSGSGRKLSSLASFVSMPDDVGAQAIKPCMDKILNIVPKTDYSTTPVILGATAGMRVLREVDGKSAEAILASVRSTVATYPFKFSNPPEQVRIIDGDEEGAFGWVTSNYLAGSFGVVPQNPINSVKDTVGALDMGGASIQITFDPRIPLATEESSAILQLFGFTYKVYTHSYLCYGMDEANRKYKALLVQMQNFSRIIADPCAPLGNESLISFSSVFKEPCTSSKTLPQYAQNLAEGGSYNFTFRGTSNSDQCKNITRGIYNASVPCRTSSCTFDGVYQPSVSDQFFAFSGFYFVASDLGLNMTSGFSLDEYRRAMDSFCNKPWTEVSKSGKSGSILVVLCFQAHHIHHLLVDFYGFNSSNWNNITFVLKINNNDFGWVLGMMLNVTNAIPSHDYASPIQNDVFIPLLVTFAGLIVLAFFSALAAIYWTRKQQQQQLGHHHYHSPSTSHSGTTNRSFCGS